MLKVIVIGSPGAGKSTFAQKLKKITNLPLYHLDMLWHKPDKTNISRERFDLEVDKILNTDKWIIDGNYQRTLEKRLIKSDTVFLLDFPVEDCILGAESRIGKKRGDLPWIEKEFDEDFKQYIINFPKEKLPEIYMLLEKYKRNKDIIVFKTREESDDYLQKLKNSKYFRNDNR